MSRRTRSDGDVGLDIFSPLPRPLPVDAVRCYLNGGKHDLKYNGSTAERLYWRCIGCPREYVVERWKWESLVTGRGGLLDEKPTNL